MLGTWLVGNITLGTPLLTVAPQGEAHMCHAPKGTPQIVTVVGHTRDRDLLERYSPRVTLLGGLISVVT